MGNPTHGVCELLIRLVPPLPAATPRDLVALLENVLMECTSFQVSGTVSKQDAEQLVDEVRTPVHQCIWHDTAEAPRITVLGHAATPDSTCMLSSLFLA